MAAAALVVAVGAVYLWGVRPSADRVADALVEDHVRYLGHADRNAGLLHVIVGSREPLLLEMAKACRSSTQ